MIRTLDTHSLTTRRPTQGTSRGTLVLGFVDRVPYGLHLLCIVATSVIAKNLALAQVLQSTGPKTLPPLYIASAMLGLLVAGFISWFSRRLRIKTLMTLVHGTMAFVLIALFVLPRATRMGLPIADSLGPDLLESAPMVLGRYVLIDALIVAMLGTFARSLTRGFGIREFRRLAEQVGRWGPWGAMIGGGLLGIGATRVQPSLAYLVASGFALMPIFLVIAPQPTQSGTGDSGYHGRVRGRRLWSYGVLLATAAVLSVLTTTVIDYQFRHAASQIFEGQSLAAFFGYVAAAAGLMTAFAQSLLLQRSLDRYGIFMTAVFRPGLLIVASAVFGFIPSLIVLITIKSIATSGRLSAHETTTTLLLAPLSERLQRHWRQRLEDLAKPLGQIIAGALLFLVPLSPKELVPWVLFAACLWSVCVLLVRARYLNMMRFSLSRPAGHSPNLGVIDGPTVRMLEHVLRTSDIHRATVILGLLEKQEHQVPKAILSRVAKLGPGPQGALLVVRHLALAGDAQAVAKFCRYGHGDVAAEAFFALDELNPELCERLARQTYLNPEVAQTHQAIAAGLLCGERAEAAQQCERLVIAEATQTRLALARALARASLGSGRVGAFLCRLAKDPNTLVARVAVAALHRHLSSDACQVCLDVLQNPKLRGPAMRTLSRFGTPVVAPLAHELRLRLDHAAAAQAICTALGQIAAAKAIPPLLEALHAPDISVRAAAVRALARIQNLRAGVGIPKEPIAAFCLREIAFFAATRAYIQGPKETSPAAKLLRRTLKNQARLSLECLFQAFALHHDAQAVASAYGTILSSRRDQRQIALELLDAHLGPELRIPLAQAVGATHAPQEAPSPQQALSVFVKHADKNLSALAALAMSATQPPQTSLSDKPAKGFSMKESNVESLLELQSFAIFAQASLEDLMALEALLVEEEYPKGARIFREGATGDAVYLIRHGQVILQAADAAPQLRDAGEAFGLLSVLDRMPREAEAQAKTPVEVYRIAAEDLYQLLQDRPELMYSLFRALSAALRQQAKTAGTHS